MLINGAPLGLHFPTCYKWGSWANPAFLTLTFSGLCDLPTTPSFWVWSHQKRKEWGILIFLPSELHRLLVLFPSSLWPNRFFIDKMLSIHWKCPVVTYVFHLVWYHRSHFLNKRLYEFNNYQKEFNYPSPCSKKFN